MRGPISPVEGCHQPSGNSRKGTVAHGANEASEVTTGSVRTSKSSAASAWTAPCRSALSESESLPIARMESCLMMS